MTAAEIAHALGAAHRSGDGWWSCRCPAHDDHSPSLSLRDGNRGIIARCWSGCDARDVLAALRRLGLLSARSVAERPLRGNDNRHRDRDDAARRIALARRIWDRAIDARGSPLVRYLAGRGIHHPSAPLAALCARAARPQWHQRASDDRAHRRFGRRTDRRASHLA